MMSFALLIILAVAFQPAFAAPPAKRAQAKRAHKAPPRALIIRPKPSKPALDPVAAFRIEKGSPGKVILRFVSKNPRYVLSSADPWVVQLVPVAPLKVQPVILTHWPKGAQQAEIAVTGARQGTIVAAEAFHLCDTAAKRCRAVRWKQAFPVTP